MNRVVVTGANGLIGWHACTRLYAANCQAGFQSKPLPYEIVALDKKSFLDDETLEKAIKGCDAIFHFAGLNRASDAELEIENPNISKRLVTACKNANAMPHLIYANSIHATQDNAYGRSKKTAGEILEKHFTKFSNFILPHIFGECARPYYNNVTATFIDQILKGEKPSINPDGCVSLVHAGAAAQNAIDVFAEKKTGDVKFSAMKIGVEDLFNKITDFHENYLKNIYPNLSDDFDVALFNCYRAATYPDSWPRELNLHSDARGTLFEAVKGGGGGQTFLSTTNAGVTRGDHFHLNKVERFLVVQGEAIIRVRKVLSDKVWEYRVSGDVPAPVDMPTMHTHSIENVGDGPLLTLFWTHDLFDPGNPDTFADKVLA